MKHVEGYNFAKFVPSTWGQIFVGLISLSRLHFMSFTAFHDPPFFLVYKFYLNASFIYVRRTESNYIFEATATLS